MSSYCSFDAVNMLLHLKRKRFLLIFTGYKTQRAQSHDLYLQDNVAIVFDAHRKSFTDELYCCLCVLYNILKANSVNA